MVKPEWGKKRICAHCATRFYDLKRNPVECPKCGTAAKEEKTPKPRRSIRPVEAVILPEIDALPVKNEIFDDGDDVLDINEDADDEDSPELEAVEGGEEDDGAIEDASDIGDPDDDMSEVKEHVDEGTVDESR